MSDQEHEANDPMRERLKNLICDLYDIRPSDARRLVAQIDTLNREPTAEERGTFSEALRLSIKTEETALTHLAQTGQLMDRIAALEARLAEAKEALQMIDSVVYNDNGDVTYDTGTMGKAHKVARATLSKLEKPSPAP